MDLSMIHSMEMEKVLEVLQRDKLLRTIEEERIRRLKSELQEIRRKGAKSYTRQYSERTCARCQRPLGKFWNSGAVCRGCSHRICSKCRVGVSTLDWKCTVCHAYREVKIRSGAWFYEERVKKFPTNSGIHQTVGEELLKSYQRFSHIAVVPPTPPPNFDCDPFSRPWELKKSRPFTKSVEDLMVSFTSHIKKISKSQNDVRGDQTLLTVDNIRRQSTCSGRKSQSDTDINKSSTLTKVPSLPNLFKRSKESDQEGSSTGAEEDTSFDSEYSGGKRGSYSSTSTECDLFEVSTVTGDLELALAFNFNTSCLEITVGSCRNLNYGDFKRKKCHPYVKVYVLPDKTQGSKLKTTVKRNTTNPVYNEMLQYQIKRPLLCGRTLQASVWHCGTLKKKVFLGEVLLPLDNWKFEEKNSESFVWYPLCPKPECPVDGAVEQDTGELLVRIKYSPLSQSSVVYQTNEVNIAPRDDGQLTVFINGAKHLPTKANTGQNTFVKGCLTLPGNRSLVQKTAILKEKANLTWSHQLVFGHIPPSDLLDSVLTLDLWEPTSLGRPDRPQGGVQIDTRSPWQLALEKPNMWHDLILPIRTKANSRRT